MSFPIPKKAAYQKFRNQASRFALVGVFVSKRGSEIRVAVTGAGSNGVFRVTSFEEALKKRFSPKSLEGMTIPADGMNSDIHGSAEYRAHLVGVLARRAVAEAIGKSADDGWPCSPCWPSAAYGRVRIAATKPAAMTTLAMTACNHEPSPRPLPASIDATVDLLAEAEYLADRSLGTVLYLALKMGRPIFLEGEAGVGKTEIAKVLAVDARPPPDPAAMLRGPRRRGRGL